MCYELYLSTSSGQDLSQYNSDLIRFERLDKVSDGYTAFLKHPWNWYVGTSTGCSCALRHFAQDDPEFCEPQDWCREEDDDIRATAELYRVIASLIAGGGRVECLNAWSGALHDEIKSMDVDLSVVSERAFCLFENHHFVFRYEAL
ncbi:MAG: hypothetical protein JW993_21210 [Sedimentisphaerales bacterium]|nr:hypothetical protein [Sedimentisphaerales bacterium]